MIDKRRPQRIHPTGASLSTEGIKQLVVGVDDSDTVAVESGVFEQSLAEVGAVNPTTDDGTINRLNAVGSSSRGVGDSRSIVMSRHGVWVSRLEMARVNKIID